MKYRCVLTLPAVASITVEVDAPNQEAAFALAYDQAYTASLDKVKLQSIDSKAAMLEVCDPLPAALPVDTSEQAAAPAEPVAPYLVQYYATPADLERKTPTREVAEAIFETACRICDELKQTRDGYMRCVARTATRSVLYTVKNDYGGYAVVVFKDQASQDAQSWSLWEGWISTQKEAKKRAMALFDQGRVHAVGVLQTQTADKPERLITTLSRS